MLSLGFLIVSSSRRKIAICTTTTVITTMTIIARVAAARITYSAGATAIAIIAHVISCTTIEIQMIMIVSIGIAVVTMTNTIMKNHHHNTHHGVRCSCYNRCYYYYTLLRNVRSVSGPRSPVHSMSTLCVKGLPMDRTGILFSSTAHVLCRPQH